MLLPAGLTKRFDLCIFHVSDSTLLSTLLAGK